MRLIISRTKRYGGITSFLLNFLENSNVTSEDVLLLDATINKEIVRIISEKYDCKIVFFPESLKKMNLITSRFFQGIFIKKMLRQNRKLNKVIFIDWNLILDWYTHTKNIEIISFVHTYPTRKLPIFFKKFVNYFIRNTKVVTVSKYSSKKISQKWQLNQNQIEILYNYSNLPGMAIARVLPKTINIVTIAHCESYKNPQLWYEIALEAIKINKNIVFHWYGDGSLYKKFQEITKENSNINFHGYSSEIEQILSKKTTVYLQCSQIESLGISILDAMNYSLPVIVLNNGGMPELVMNNENGYICFGKKDVVAKILGLVTNDMRYKSMSKKSKERYESLFSKKIWLNNLMRIMVFSKESETL